MNEKDEQLNTLFDGYADELQPRPDLARSARAELARKTANKKSRPKKFGVIFGSLAAAAVVAVFAFGVIPSLVGKNDITSTPPADGSAQPIPPDVISYALSDVRAVRSTRAEVKDRIDLTEMERAGYEIFNENYYSCYIKNNNTLAYVKAVFGVSTAYGNIEVEVIAESDGMQRQDLADRYAALIAGNNIINYYKTYKDGEYMTAAYISDYDLHYYVSTTGNVDGAENLFEYFL